MHDKLLFRIRFDLVEVYPRVDDVLCEELLQLVIRMVALFVERLEVLLLNLVQIVIVVRVELPYLNLGLRSDSL